MGSERQSARAWVGLKWFRRDPVAGSCEHGNEHYGSTKGEEFIDQLADCRFLNKDAAPRSYKQGDLSPLVLPYEGVYCISP
jgi:hypothetical protein